MLTSVNLKLLAHEATPKMQLSKVQIMPITGPEYSFKRELLIEPNGFALSFIVIRAINITMT